MKIGIVAGEASGDLLGANLLKALHEIDSTISATGVGGPLMIQEGFDSHYDMQRLSVMGLIEPLFHLADLFKIRRHLKNYFIQHPPAVFIGIDSPDFNLGLESQLRQAGIPIVHYVSPSVWAWRKNRIKKIKKSVDLMLTLFPFEAKFYQEHDVPVCLIGHPLADLIPLQPDKQLAREKLNLDPSTTYIALLPGSRRNEIRFLAETFIKTALRCWKEKPAIKFITSAINEELNLAFQEQCQRLAPELPIDFFIQSSHDVICAADMVLVTSGTATLECMLYKRPMVVAYKMSGMTYQLAKRLVTIPHMSLPNLLANELLVPEFLQHAANEEALSSALLYYIDHPEKISFLEEKFLQLHKQLKMNASETAAKAIMKLVGRIHINL